MSHLPEALVVVLGATGRVGGALLPLLADRHDLALVAVWRSTAPAPVGREVQWVRADLVDEVGRRDAVEAIRGLAAPGQRVLIVDLILNRSTVTAMCASIDAVTSLVILLGAHLADDGTSVCLVAGTTTAVLAPRPYRTPYGRAKRRQLARYVDAGLSGDAVLLPQLGGEHQRSDTFWTFEDAATRLAQSIQMLVASETDRLRLVVPRLGPTTMTRQHRRGVGAITRIIGHNLASWTIQRDSPESHRRASRGRLALTPHQLRQRVDHHRAPAGRVRRLSNMLGCPILWEPA